MRSFVSAVAVAVAAVLTATGCAGAGASGSSSLGGPASLVPADAVAFVALETDLAPAQLRVVDGLLSRFPARDVLLARLRQGLEGRARVSWAGDVRPALGSELDLVALAGSPAQLVVLTRPPDQTKFDELLAKLGGGVVLRQFGDWTAVSTSVDALGALEHVTAPLADAGPYQAAMSKLAGDALVRAYADGAQARRLLTSLPGQVVATPPPVRARFGAFGRTIGAYAPERFGWGAADVVAVDGGVRVEAFTRAAPPSLYAIQHSRLVQLRTDAYVPLLIDEIPAGALLVADYQAVQGEFENADPATLPAWLKELYARYPVLSYELDNLVGGETAIYVRAGMPLPEITFVTQPADVDRAISVLPEVLAELEGTFPPLARLTIRHAVIGGQLVLSTSAGGIAAFRAPGAKLRDDPAFEEATKAAGLPERTTGFVYADLKAALPLLRTLAPKAGLGDLAALTSLTAYGTRTGAESSYMLFLQVQ